MVEQYIYSGGRRRYSKRKGKKEKREKEKGVKETRGEGKVEGRD